MKQHITEEQLNELSEKGKERLRKWWKPKEYDLYMNEEGEVSSVWCCEDDVTSTDMPLLSIGQMIEFLNEYGEIYLGTVKIITWEPTQELFDVLWQSVKEVLEKKAS